MAQAKLNIKRKRMIERLGLEAVPSSLKTTTAIEYTMIQVAISVNAGNFLIPAFAVIEGHLSFFYAVLSTILGAALAFLLVSFLSLPGAKYGIPAQYAIRSILGVKGTRYLASSIRTITSLYWFSVQTIGGTYLLKEIIKRVIGYDIPFYIIAIPIAMIMALLALIGFDAVKKVTKYFLPVLFLGGLVMGYIFITSSEAGMAFTDVISKKGNNQLSMMFFYASLAFVQYVSGVSSASDMARYAKSTKHAFVGLYLGNLMGFMITAFLGAYTATLAGSTNPYVISTQLTNSPLLILIIFIAAIAAMISINLSNAYTGGYSLLNSFPKLGRVKSATIFGVVAIILSSFPHLVNEAKDYISLLGGFVIPLSAVIVSDFLFIKKAALSPDDFQRILKENYHYNFNGFIAIIIGMIAYYFIIPENLSPGFLTFIGTSILYILIKKMDRTD